MTTSNTQGLIQKSTKDIVKTVTKSASQRMSEVLNSTATQKLLDDVIKENKGAFIASLLDVYGSDNYLSKCNPGLVVKEALKAVSLKLPINKQLGFAYIIPYKDWKTQEMIPQFQLGYKGLIQLAMRTGAYKYINAGNVYEGMLKNHNQLTGMVDLSGDAENDKVVGYFAYIETLNGFVKAYYWTVDEVLKHVKRYSKSYDPSKGIWKDNFDEMAQKTVLRNLLSKWAILSVDIQTALSEDDIRSADELISNDDDVVYGNDTDTVTEIKADDIKKV